MILEVISRMREKSWDYLLDYSSSDRCHVRIEYDNRKLLNFAVTYSAITETNKEIEIVCFDGSHGTVHMHKNYLKPAMKQELFKTINPRIVEECIEEIEENYLYWKNQYQKNYGVKFK